MAMNPLAAFDSQAGAKLVFNAGNHLYNFRRLAKAREFYEKAVQLNPDYVEAHFNLGVVLAQTLGPAQAIPQWQRALELKPDFGPARQMLERYKSSSSPLPGQMIIN
jgi:tetratricopeptide (TPR) repeat protein